MKRLNEVLPIMQSYWPERRRPLGRMAINLAPRPSFTRRRREKLRSTIKRALRSPHGAGGGNQFVLLLTRYLRFCGYEVVFNLDDAVDCIIIVDGRDELNTFGMKEIAAFKQRHPSVACIHRINECDKRKGTDHMDDVLARTNTVADHTVFISGWLRDYHVARWFDASKPHTVIHNGADPSIFHPIGNHPPANGEAFRLVTHHWSDNRGKGFEVYEELDRLIANKHLPGMELWIIGRWPSGMQWRSARLFEPVTGRRLADLLRQCHAYVTGSLWEPGGMHFIEGAQCGLPVLFHADGGGIVEVAERFGICFRDDLVGAVKALRQDYDKLRQKVLDDGPSGDRMCSTYRQLIQTLLVAGGKAS